MSTAQVTSLFTARETMSRTLNNIAQSTTRLDNAFGRMRGRLRSAVEFNLVSRGMDLMWRGVDRLVHALPDLIARGNQWATTVDRIADITGMAAGEASELAAVAENVGVNADGLGRMMNALARSVSTNADEFRDYGIRIKDGNGHLLSAYQIFQNVRQRIAEMGPSLQAAKLSQMAFGRAALESADMLTLSNDQWERQAQLARESGLILTEQGLAAAEEWERTQSRLGQAITGIGAQIMQGVAPALIGLTNGVTKTINANMGAIVRFGAGLVNFLANLAADLLGIQIDTTTLIGNAYDDAAKRADRLRQRVDDMTNANQRSAAAQRQGAAATDTARRQQQRLREELERAQRQLSRARAGTTFTGGMNDVELELFRQRKAAQVKAAQDRVADARKALMDHRETMGQMEGMTAAAARRMRLGLQKTFGGGGEKGAIIEGLSDTLRDSKTFALGISDAIKDAIFGPDQQIQLGGGTPLEIRSGGLIGEFGKLGTFLGTVGGHLNNLNTLLGGPAGLIAGVLGLAAVVRLIPGVPTVANNAPGVLSTIARSPVGPFGIAAALNAFLREGGPRQPDEYGPFGGMGMTGFDTAMAVAGPRMGGARDAAWRVMSQMLGSVFNGRPGAATSRYPNPNQNPELFPAPGAGPYGPQGSGLMNPYAVIFDRSLRRYLGVSSPLVLGQDDQLGLQAGIYGASQATADQTVPLGNGSLGVTNPNFPDIGTIMGWRAGALGVEGRGGVFRVDNASGTYLGIWPNGGKKLPVEGSSRIDWGSTGGQIRKTATWTETTARRLQYGDYSTGRLLYEIWQQLKRGGGGSNARVLGSSSLRP